MNFSDVKLLLPASGYMKTSEVNGRTVIDEMRDASYERNHQTFVGADRPEFTDYNGVPSVDVEKESTNIILDSRDITNWGGSAGAVKDQVGYDGKLNTACLVTDNSDSSILSKDRNKSVNNDGQSHTNSFFIKKDNNETRFPEMFLFLTGGTTVELSVQINTKTGATISRVNTGGTGVFYVEDRGDYWRLIMTITNNNSGNTLLLYRFRPAISTVFGGADVSTTGSAIVDQFQLELNSSYPTNPIITQGTAVTRLAPSPVIQNALPETGSVAFRGDIVRDDSVNQDIFVTTGDAGTDLSRLRINTSNEFELQIFGSTGGSITQANPFTGWGNNERLDLQIGLNYDATNLYLFLSDGTNTYFYTVAHDINSSTNKDFTFGNNHSMRILNTYKDEISRTTQTEFETLFSLI